MKITRCRLSKSEQSKLIEFFVAEVTARTAANLVGINHHSARLFYHKIRLVIASRIEQKLMLDGEIELDESYFGGARKGNRGRGAAGKVPVFGMLKRNGFVYACMIPDASTKSLMPIIESKIKPDSIVYTDSWTAYNKLDIAGFKHFRINHSVEFANKGNHINGIENFWNQAKRVLRKYNGVPRENFHLFLKECEFRFNFGSPKQQLKILKKWCTIGS